ncbi:MAG: excinuclease ABC subunit UvrB [Candidatus Lokiarchaeota archaeon]|nr:excinuclease ABC subunit UvrB [Candidatus Lokiarchaeota archaeon]
MKFQIKSDYQPKGDQPKAIEKLVDGIRRGDRLQTLLGITGSGKTYTIANVIQEVQLPTLVMSPNKTLAAQLYNEFKELFPDNAVEYYVSYYNYYQPEAYMPTTDRYIEKDMDINHEIERMRLSSCYSLLTRNDVIVVASVSAIYGLGNPQEWRQFQFLIEVGQNISRDNLIKGFLKTLHERDDIDFQRGKFRVRGDIIDIYPAYMERAYRIELFGDEIESIHEIHPVTLDKIRKVDKLVLFPAKHFIIPDYRFDEAIQGIEDELEDRVAELKADGKLLEAHRLEQRTKYDLEMIRELGYCTGIENYSRFLDGRKPGQAPRTLLDYFPDKYLIVVDESHIAVPQIHGMIDGDRSRKKNLVDFGFRLPSSYDNRPLTFEEWRARIKQAIFMSATPGDWETRESTQVVEMIIRPTGLLDPLVEVRPTSGQIDDLVKEIAKVVKVREKAMVTTLTKNMAENLSEYFKEVGVRSEYLHDEVQTMERAEIIRRLRMDEFDVLVGINLLREGLDIPEVSLIGILDADKEGFLRDTRSLIQTIGRASRNVNGHVIMYGDTMTRSMKAAIEETNRRRKMQVEYNHAHGIVPRTIKKAIPESMSEELAKQKEDIASIEAQIAEKAKAMNSEIEIAELIRTLELQMLDFAAALKFEQAAYLRDKIRDMKATYLGQGKKK